MCLFGHAPNSGAGLKEMLCTSKTKGVQSMNEKQDRVGETLSSLIQLFESGKAPEALAVTVLPSPDVPSHQWSLNNRLLLWIAGTGDARGYRQWQEVGRHVQKGRHAIFILAPRLKRVQSSQEVPAQAPGNAAAGAETKGRQVLCGFLAVPVFRFEDTEGEPLQPNLNPPELPPLSDVAQAWGLKIQYAGRTGPYLGMYRHSEDGPGEILLATQEEQVFFHELAHAAQYRVWSDLKPDQKARKEIAAELAACVLARLYGRRSPDEGRSYQYIKHYCEQDGRSLVKALWGMVADTEAILHAIVETHSQAACV
jgi:hypothetical protein